MINLQYVENIQAGNYDDSVKLLSENMSFVLYLYKQMGVQSRYFDDFKQLAWLALIETAKAFDFSYGNEKMFKALWNRYIMKQYLDLRRKQDFSIVVSRSTYTKLKSTVGIENSILVTESYDMVYSVLGSDIQFDVELSMIRRTLWDEVRYTLNKTDYRIIYDYYRREKKLKTIASELGRSAESVRKQKYRALRKLKNNKYIAEVAKEFFGLRT